MGYEELIKSTREAIKPIKKMKLMVKLSKISGIDYQRIVNLMNERTENPPEEDLKILLKHAKQMTKFLNL